MGRTTAAYDKFYANDESVLFQIRVPFETNYNKEATASQIKISYLMQAYHKPKKARCEKIAYQF